MPDEQYALRIPANRDAMERCKNRLIIETVDNFAGVFAGMVKEALRVLRPGIATAPSTPSAVILAQAGIQYAAAPRFDRKHR